MQNLFAKSMNSFSGSNALADHRGLSGTTAALLAYKANRYNTKETMTIFLFP